MIALSVRQPWAWLIIHGGKDIENRTWYTGRRGRVAIHASKSMRPAEYEAAVDTIIALQAPCCSLPHIEDLQLGGIVGSVEIVDCVRESGSPWHAPGQWGFVLRDPQPQPYQPWKGQLGFFEVPTP